jgi:hypothetical protein
MFRTQYIPEIFVAEHYMILRNTSYWGGGGLRILPQRRDPKTPRKYVLRHKEIGDKMCVESIQKKSYVLCPV